MFKKSKRYQQLSKLSEAVFLEEADPIKLIWFGVIGVAVFLILLFLWATFTTFDEVAITYGQVVPYGPQEVVQHLEGGIVAHALVKDGDIVKKGQLLLTMDPKTKTAELEQMQSREASLLLDQARLNAFINQQQSDVTQWEKLIVESSYGKVATKQQIRDMVKKELELLQAQNHKRDDQQKVAQSQVAKYKEDLQQLIEDKKIYDKNIKLYQQEYEMYKKLSNKDLISKRDLIVAERNINKAQAEESRIRTEIEKTRVALKGAEGASNEVESNLREASVQELNKIQSELLELRHTITRLQERVARSDVYATTSG